VTLVRINGLQLFDMKTVLVFYKINLTLLYLNKQNLINYLSKCSTDAGAFYEGPGRWGVGWGWEGPKSYKRFNQNAKLKKLQNVKIMGHRI